MKFLILVIFAFSSLASWSQDQKPKVQYEYKKLEKFDFDEIGVQGEAGSPGDLSVNPRLRSEFKNKLPERQNFNKEMKKSLEGIH